MKLCWLSAPGVNWGEKFPSRDFHFFWDAMNGWSQTVIVLEKR